MLDAFMGLFYTFLTTLLILYGLKIVHSIYKRRWAPVFSKSDDDRRWRLEATPQHFLRDRLVILPLLCRLTFFFKRIVYIYGAREIPVVLLGCVGIFTFFEHEIH